MLSNFEDKSRLSVGDFESVEDWRKVVVELNVDNGTDDSDDSSLGLTLRRCSRLRRMVTTYIQTENQNSSCKYLLFYQIFHSFVGVELLSYSDIATILLGRTK